MPEDHHPPGAETPIGPDPVADAATLPPSPSPSVAGAATLPPSRADSDGAGRTADYRPGGSRPASPGAVVPGYEILAELGRGGMGVVYKARQVGLNRVVALKMILSGAHASADDLARFRVEGEAVARLQHPGIVQVFEVGEHDGLPFFSLEFVEGGGLDRTLDGTPRPPRDAASLVGGLALAVHEAHRKGVVHRDLKPQNVLLTADGRPKVADFGLAKRLDVEGVTQSGAIMGTPSYMAPEQAGGKPEAIGPPTDVYALGAILYELLTGRPPFKAATPLDTMLLLATEEPVPPTRMVPGIPRDLEIICLKCLEKEPNRRYESAEALAKDLRRWLEGEPIAARPASGWERAEKWTRRHPTVAGLSLAVVLVGLIGTAGVLWEWRAAVASAREASRRRDEAETANKLLGIAIADVRKKSNEVEGANQKLGIALEDVRKQRDEVKTANDRLGVALDDAIRQRDKAGRSAYLANMGLAFREYESAHMARVEELLDAQKPDPKLKDAPDYRAFEWYYLRRLSHSEKVSVEGYSTFLSQVAYSPDGRRIACASRSGPVAMIWDAETGAAALKLKGHAGTHLRVAYSPDGKRVATTSTDATARTWDAETGAPILALKGHKGWVEGLAYGPDGRLIATGDQGKTVRIWDAETGALKATLDGHKDRLQSLAFRPDGRQLASASVDGTVKLWDVDPEAGTGREAATLPGHPGAIWAVAYRHDGKRLASSGQDGTVRLWDLDASPAAEIRAIRAYPPIGPALMVDAYGRPNPLMRNVGTLQATAGLAFARDGRLLATAGPDGLVKVWDAETGAEVVDFRGHTRGVNSLAFRPDGKRLASAGDDGMVRVWDLERGPGPMALRGHKGPVSAVAFSPDGRHLASGGSDATARVWDLDLGVEARPLASTSNVYDLAYSPDGQRVAATTAGGWLVAWDAETGAESWKIQKHFLINTPRLAFRHDGRRVALSCGNGEIEVADAQTGATIKRSPTGIGPTHSVAYAPDGKQIALGGSGVRVVDAETLKEITTLRSTTTTLMLNIKGLAYSPDGKRIAASSEMHQPHIMIYDVTSGRTLQTLKGHTGNAVGLAYSPDGKRVASASLDGTVKVWDVETGAETLNLAAFEGPALDVAFSTDGRRLAASGQDGTVRVWDATDPDLRWVRSGVDRTRPATSKPPAP